LNAQRLPPAPPEHAAPDRPALPADSAARPASSPERIGRQFRYHALAPVAANLAEQSEAMSPPDAVSLAALPSFQASRHRPVAPSRSALAASAPPSGETDIPCAFPVADCW